MGGLDPLNAELEGAAAAAFVGGELAALWESKSGMLIDRPSCSAMGI